jgi:hypothetical protein
MTGPVPPDDSALRARAKRNLVIAGALIVFVTLVFAITVVRLGGGSP